MDPLFFNRDISWLSFNERVLSEAGKASVPLLERIRFLSIYSSNLDEFYRVRMPALLALQQKYMVNGEASIYEDVVATINHQQEKFGTIFNEDILPALKAQDIHLLYANEIPPSLDLQIREYFFTTVAGFLQPVLLNETVRFFPENNALYLAALVQFSGKDEDLYLINIPTDNVSRFLTIRENGLTYIVFLEDVIKENLTTLFPAATIKGAYNLKITRDAEMHLHDEGANDLADELEKQLSKRELGYATRLLYEPGIPLRQLQHIVENFNLHKASVVAGGRHHNLKDLADFPLTGVANQYIPWPAVKMELPATLFAAIAGKDQVVHAPYQSYDTVLRFFNEAAIDPVVQEIYTTLYRVAGDSRIVNALISAAKNGKNVMVVVELKARFDEANNIRWAKKMKAAGVKIVYSNNALKVHAKIALIKRTDAAKPYLALLATGNLNERTARFYTDHILLTAHQSMAVEMEKLFVFLAKRKTPDTNDHIVFEHLLVAQFNLQTIFLALIDKEIAHAKSGLPASIILKMNNLEEEVMIKKLYQASNAGVTVQLIIRGICRLVAGVDGMSANITVKRIVDRYLEHGRIFIFHNNGQEKIFMGSADWMNRNIYHRIEVCFPVYDETIKEEIKSVIALQLADNVQAVFIDKNQMNRPAVTNGLPVRSQEAIYNLLSAKPAD